MTAPRTAECVHGFIADCEQCWWIRTHEHSWELSAPDDAVCSANGCVATRGTVRQREAEAGVEAVKQAQLDIAPYREALERLVERFDLLSRGQRDCPACEGPILPQGTAFYHEFGCPWLAARALLRREVGE
jgi:hypothetical protein